jgi:hypothetical protein
MRRVQRTIDNGGKQAQADAFVAKINAAWQKSVESIIETGLLLIEARDALGYGQWGSMFATAPLTRGAGRLSTGKVNFSERTAQRLMTIAKHPVLSNPTHVSHLPASWGTLYELTTIPIREMERLIASGVIHPDLRRRDVRYLDCARNHPYEQAHRALSVLRDFMRGTKADALAGHLFHLDPPYARFTSSELREMAEKLPSYVNELIGGLERRAEEQSMGIKAWLADEGRKEKEEVAARSNGSAA